MSKSSTSWQLKAGFQLEQPKGREPLVPARFTAASFPGVEQIDLNWVRSPMFVPAGENPDASPSRLTITVGMVDGITPLGRHVVMNHGMALSATIWPGNASRCLLDLSISVNAQNAADPFTLAADIAASDAPPFVPNALYLGRYEWLQGSLLLNVVLYPLVRRLAAFPTQSPEWKEWTAPVAKTVASLLNGAQHAIAAPSALACAYATEAYRLAAHWAMMPVVELANQLRYVHALAELHRTSALTIPDSFVESVAILPDSAPLGSALPRKLIETFVTTTQQTQSCQLVKQIRRHLNVNRLKVAFLQNLGPGRLELRAPVSLFRSASITIMAKDGSVFQNLKDGGIEGQIRKFYIDFPQGPALPNPTHADLVQRAMDYEFSPIKDDTQLEFWYTSNP